MIEHKIISIKKGDNQLEIPVEHAHFPNFRVSVALIDGRVLRGASKRFNIRRELKVAITPSKAWRRYPVFAIRFEGPRSLTISTGRHVISDGGATLSADGRTVYFSSARVGSPDWDIFTAERGCL